MTRGHKAAAIPTLLLPVTIAQRACNRHRSHDHHVVRLPRGCVEREDCALVPLCDVRRAILVLMITPPLAPEILPATGVPATQDVDLLQVLWCPAGHLHLRLDGDLHVFACPGCGTVRVT